MFPARLQDMGETGQNWPGRAAIFGASGGIGRVLAEKLLAGGAKVYVGACSGQVPQGEGAVPFTFDLEDEQSIAAAADLMRSEPPDLAIVATGVLTLGDEGPERSFKKLDADFMARNFRLNAIGPALVAKHMLPLFDRKGRGVFAALSARVGSITDNRLGGWHSYRASKAALNMLIRNFAIETGRTHDKLIVCGLHPGTVDTALSEPFQGNIPDEQLFTPENSASHLLDVVHGLKPADSGKLFAWDGAEIPF